MLRQEKGYGCGLYAVANALGLNNFVTEERLELSKRGVNNGELAKYLQEDGADLFIDVMYCDTTKSKIPEDWLSIFSEGDNDFCPILIQCVISEKFHLMGARLLKEPGKIELFDSLREDSIICTLSDVNKMYEHVVGLYSFNKMAGTDYLFLSHVNDKNA